MLKIGHRGASGALPENSLEAFARALELGADGVELDLHCCKSGELVVIHDDTVDRTTDGTGRVADLTLQQLQRLRLKGGGRIPTLTEVLSRLGPRARYFLECKHADAMDAAAAALAAYLAQGWDAQNLCLISFAHAPLAAALRAHPQLVGGASFERLDARSVHDARRIGARVMVPQYDSVTAAFLAEAHAAGLGVIVWTVNAPADIARLFALGVDGIMSDYPERLGSRQ